MSSDSFLIPAATATFEETIKKSRFITLIAHTQGRDAAKAFLESVRAKHPDARHHCWAFISGRPDDAQLWGFSDDGEPSGTAGKPILARLQGTGYGEICAAVVRYSGGIKLGTGGLVRAYGGGVGGALEALQTLLKVPQTQFTLTCSYDQLNDVQHILQRHDGLITDTQYGGQLQLALSVPSLVAKAFCQDLHNHSKGLLTPLIAE